MGQRLVLPRVLSSRTSLRSPPSKCSCHTGPNWTLQLSDPPTPRFSLLQILPFVKIIKVTEEKLGDTAKELDLIIIPTAIILILTRFL